MSHSPRVFLASFGYRKIIEHVLKHHKLTNLFTEVLTPAVVGLPEGIEAANKNSMINYGLKQHQLSKALLVDHVKDNVDAATREGRWGYWLDYHKGLTHKDTEAILELVEKNNVDAVFLSVDASLFKGHVTPQYIYRALTGCSLIEPPDAALSEGVKPLLQALIKEEEEEEEDTLEVSSQSCV